jgi:hypothetical protein
MTAPSARSYVLRDCWDREIGQCKEDCWQVPEKKGFDVPHFTEVAARPRANYALP